MPEISRFFGIVIGMFWEADVRHHGPHFHVRYQEYKASFGLEPIELLAGSLPTRQRRFVEAWAELHHDELKKDWVMLMNDENPDPIKPLE